MVPSASLTTSRTTSFSPLPRPSALAACAVVELASARSVARSEALSTRLAAPGLDWVALGAFDAVASAVAVPDCMPTASSAAAATSAAGRGGTPLGVDLNADSFCKGVPDGWVGLRAEQGWCDERSKIATRRVRCQGRVKRLAGNGSLSEDTYPVSGAFTYGCVPAPPGMRNACYRLLTLAQQAAALTQTAFTVRVFVVLFPGAADVRSQGKPWTPATVIDHVPGGP